MHHGVCSAGMGAVHPPAPDTIDEPSTTAVIGAPARSFRSSGANCEASPPIAAAGDASTSRAMSPAAVAAGGSARCISQKAPPPPGPKIALN
eukprot:5238619-Prymnesium_polylepis.3